MRLISTSPSFTVDLDVSDSHHVEELTMAKLATPQKNEWAHERDPHRGMSGLRSGGPHRRVNGLRSGGPHRGVNEFRSRVPQRGEWAQEEGPLLCLYSGSFQPGARAGRLGLDYICLKHEGRNYFQG